jgi:hypothetical protein
MLIDVASEEALWKLDQSRASLFGELKTIESWSVQEGAGDLRLQVRLEGALTRDLCHMPVIRPGRISRNYNVHRVSPLALHSLYIVQEISRVAERITASEIFLLELNLR